MLIYIDNQREEKFSNSVRNCLINRPTIIIDISKEFIMVKQLGLVDLASWLVIADQDQRVKKTERVY